MANRDHVKLAERNALHSDMRTRIGAVVSKRKKVLGTGFNKPKTHPKTNGHPYKPNAGLHAEMSACLGIDVSDLVGATVTVVRIKKDGSWGLARPCNGCCQFLRKLGLARMVYSTGQQRICAEETI